jgi:LPXTG-site transpeptidase (sortase) family protein
MLGGGAVAAFLGIALIAIAAVTMLGGGGDSRPVEQVIHLTDTPSPTPRPIVTAAPTASPVPTPPLGDNAYVMVIPKLGIDAPVQAFGLDENQVPEVPTGPGQAPGEIVAWYNFTAKPGTGSNAVFAGHVTWNGNAVFYNLTSIAKDDEIRLKGDDGTELTYKVADVFDVNASDPNSVQVMSPTPTDTLTIITCDGTTTYVGGPFGVEYNNRLVVQAKLQSVTPGAAVAAAGSNTGG